MSNERKQRSDKKIRVNPSFNFEDHDKLVMLSTACGVTKTKMAEILIHMVLNDEKSIENVQNRLGIDENAKFRVRTLEINGDVFLRYKNFTYE